jgi:hypothetical protein
MTWPTLWRSAWAAFSGGLESPVWRFCTPHGAVCSGAARYAMALGTLDAAIVGVLALQETILLPLHPLPSSSAPSWDVTSSTCTGAAPPDGDQPELQEANLRLTETVAIRRPPSGSGRTLGRLRESEERYRARWSASRTGS